MGTLTPAQTAKLLQGLGALQREIRSIGLLLDQLLTIFGSIPPDPPKPGP